MNSYLPDVEVKTDLTGFSSGQSYAFARRHDKTCSWDKCSYAGRTICVSGAAETRLLFMKILLKQMSVNTERITAIRFVSCTSLFC